MFKLSKIYIFISIFTLFISSQINLFADHLDEFDGEIKLSGQIVNGTTPNVETIYEIKLMATQNASSELIDIEIINTKKNFDFKKIDADEAFTYFLIVNHQNIPTIKFIEDIENPENITITVYDRVFTPEDIEVLDYSIMIPHISPESDIILSLIHI